MLKKIRILTEITIIIFSFVLASSITFGYVSTEHKYSIILISVIFVTSSYLQNLHQSYNIFNYLVKSCNLWIIIAVFLIIMSIFYSNTIGGKVLFLWLILAEILLVIAHYVYNTIYKVGENILIIGAHYQLSSYEKKLLDNKKIKVIVKNDANNIIHTIIANKIDTVIAQNNILSTAIITKIKSKKVRYATFTYFMEKYLEKCYVPDINATLLDDIKDYSTRQKFIKFIIDYLAVIVLTIITLPIILLSIFKIKSQSPGKAIFAQPRVGYNDKEFTIYKFRSMLVNAEKDGIKFATKNDNRAFKYGNFMRKTRIDELPQLINILKRDMHFIGPRPERKHWITHFEKVISHYNLRHLVKPGISGWAQIHYPYGENAQDAEQKLMYDLYYIKNWNLALELEIIVKTMFVIIYRKGI